MAKSKKKSQSSSYVPKSVSVSPSTNKGGIALAKIKEASKRSDDEGYLSYSKFLAKKGKDRPGGTMFRVYNGSSLVGSIWARSKEDLSNFLNFNRMRFTRITQM